MGKDKNGERMWGVRNGQFPGDKIGASPDDDPDSFEVASTVKDWRNAVNSLMRKLDQGEQEKEKIKIPPEASHKIGAGHIFWFTPNPNEIGWQADQPIYLKMLAKGKYDQSSKFEVVYPEEISIQQLSTRKSDTLFKGKIIYTTRAKKLGKKQ